MHALGDKADRYSLPRPVQGALGKLRQRKYSLMAFKSSWSRASEAKTNSDPLGVLGGLRQPSPVLEEFKETPTVTSGNRLKTSGHRACSQVLAFSLTHWITPGRLPPVLTCLLIYKTGVNPSHRGWFY